MNSFANIKTIAKRELSGYFGSPVAYVSSSYFSSIVYRVSSPLRPGPFSSAGQASLDGSFFMWHPCSTCSLVPAVGMRSGPRNAASARWNY